MIIQSRYRETATYGKARGRVSSGPSLGNPLPFGATSRLGLREIGVLVGPQKDSTTAGVSLYLNGATLVTGTPAKEDEVNLV